MSVSQFSLEGIHLIFKLRDVPNVDVVPASKLIVGQKLHKPLAYHFFLEYLALLIEFPEEVLKIQIVLLIFLEGVHLILELVNNQLLLVSLDPQGCIVLG